MRSWAVVVLAASLCSCSDSPKSRKPSAPPIAHSIGADGAPVSGAPEPEVVRLRRVATVDGLLHVTVGNVSGDYLLACIPDANKGHGIQSCRAPLPQGDYLLFRKDTKWLVSGAKEPMSLAFMQEFSVTYSAGENIGLLSAHTSEEGGFRMYWLLSWSAHHHDNE